MARLVASKREDGTIEKELFSPESLKQNAVSLTNGRTIIAIAGGITSGILGLTGLQGGLCYFVYMLLFTLTLVLKLGWKYEPYFASWNQICVDGIFGSITTYILFWTLAYNSVHVF
ncbi:putative subunit of ER membrane protein complex [Chloropicon primus]|uniref:ER membrane protein complex subunit 6 n=1 Tax=Chloropicon primus TaxID=1764295 RepID=A0A5B8MHM6_9CHLO|nr:putative subunit of ER membrane protein complex [Chloropicon primus]UPQ98992.1 putative subunit of ER membrane protein complex [Chloropicon primus]|mmetsp:Transcript_12819/g.35870  ORF Transcript_12819/g.35870 Transcript_12819/m.35870 type:complete len:116 (-) Transcript_12819:765-1112(-)|eukprot:QDZ19781.1 putative subunit of ER membrane protein complex [Chloropicon primus]